MTTTITGEIENDLENTRRDLHSNFEELEEKVKSVVDWRQHYQNHPGAIITAAIGAGALLALIVGARKDRGAVSDSGPVSVAPRMSRAKQPVLEKWDAIKSALVGVAATRFTGLLADLIPGFHDQLGKTESEKAARARGTNGGEAAV